MSLFNHNLYMQFLSFLDMFLFAYAFNFLHVRHFILCILSCASPRICVYHLFICIIVYTYNSYHFIIWNLIFHIVQTDRHFQVKSCYRRAAEKTFFFNNVFVCMLLLCSQYCLYMTASGAYTQGTIRCKALWKE